MQYLLLFLEGIITFISPCMLPMLPIYISYFAGGADANNKRVLTNAIGFVLGFTMVFMMLGMFSATLGVFLNRHIQIFNVVAGGIVVIFGLHYMGLIPLAFLNRWRRKNRMAMPQSILAAGQLRFFSSFLFGLIFSVGWTPCVGAFLGSALMLASQGGSALSGGVMLFVFSMGLGIPFVISALLIGQLRVAFAVIKRHYRVVTTLSGGLLVVVGIFMMTGHLNRLLGLLAG